MTDLTAITTPFGLLDAETQEALKAHGGPWEMWFGAEGWINWDKPGGDGAFTYRVKPAPPKPREWWVSIDPKTMMFFQWPRKPDFTPPMPLIHVREVLE